MAHTFTLQVFHTLHVCKSTWKAHISMTTFFECPNSNGSLFLLHFIVNMYYCCQILLMKVLHKGLQSKPLLVTFMGGLLFGLCICVIEHVIHGRVPASGELPRPWLLRAPPCKNKMSNWAASKPDSRLTLMLVGTLPSLTFRQSKLMDRIRQAMVSPTLEMKLPQHKTKCTWQQLLQLQNQVSQNLI